MSSIDMNTVMMLRRNRNPATPSTNSTALRMRYQERGTPVTGNPLDAGNPLDVGCWMLVKTNPRARLLHNQHPTSSIQHLFWMLVKTNPGAQLLYNQHPTSNI